MLRHCGVPAKEGSWVAKVRAVLVATPDLIKFRRERGSDFMG